MASSSIQGNHVRTSLTVYFSYSEFKS
ncbi:rCG44625 [Rattus norvegicus]|uniref:RCG44625 n=1 Tax=Rattus norvegicus TaxID=10116 RepID=A6I4J8_RAT|nr:rCG44625 [Rattus norvegicus]